MELSAEVIEEPEDPITTPNPNKKVKLRGGTNSSAAAAGCCCPCLTQFQYWSMMLLFGGLNFIDAMIYSIPSAFYPKEAESKGLTSSEYGFVFGIYELSEFIASPLAANYMYKMTPRCVFYAGMLTTGTSVVLFGFLHRINDHITFLTLSLLLRIVEAASSGLMFVAAYTIVTDFNPESATRTIALMELFFGLGFSTGPLVGEGLYLLGGFELPFVALGVLFLAVGVGITMSQVFGSDVRLGQETTKSENTEIESAEENSALNGGILSLITVPSIFLQCFAIVVGNICFSFLLAVLEPHLREFDIQPMGIGLAFFLNGILYALFMPVFAQLSEYIERTEFLELVGAFLQLGAMILVGPAPFLQLQPSVKWVVMGLALNGVGLAAIYISSFVITLREARAAECRDPHSLVSALWMSCMTLGSFIGPGMAGILTDQWGFSRSTYALQGLSVIFIILLVGRLMRSKCLMGSIGVRKNSSQIQGGEDQHWEDKPLLACQ